VDNQSAVKTLTLPDALPLAFMLLFTRSAGFFMALPPLLGISVAGPVTVLLSAVLAGSLLWSTTVMLPAASLGLLVGAAMLLREAVVGFAIALATAVMIGAVGLAGEAVGAQMELSASELLNASIPTGVTAEIFIVTASFLFFGSGLHRVLFLALAKSLDVAPLGAMTFPGLTQILKGSEGMLVLGTSIAMPLLVPLFIVILAQGVISRISPQVSLLVGAPAAVALSGLGLLLLDASGLAWRIERAWEQALFTMLAWVNG
jgi:flagellar biosynthesis protein FliR